MERVLIRVGGSTVTVREFHEAFESGITAPSVLYSDLEALRKERFRTLNRLTEELVILERARELDLEISDEELAQSVADFKRDFPGNTFEETLMENGISYMVWQKGLKRRLLMEKVIRQDVSMESFQVPLPASDTTATRMDANFEAQIAATGDDREVPMEEAPESDFEAQIAATEDDREVPMEEVPESESGDSEDITDADAPETDTVYLENDPKTPPARVLPENKAEPAYDAWIAGLKKRYTIEIDWKLWEEIEQEDIGGN